MSKEEREGFRERNERKKKKGEAKNEQAKEERKMNE